MSAPVTDGLTQASSESGEDGDISTGFLVGGGAALVLLLGAGGVVAMRRRGTVGDRE